MSIRARNIHFSNWTKVIEALANNGITVANEEEARTFLIETNSDANPFYYFVGYIKTTKEIYTHGQFYDCSEYDDSTILQKIEELESTLDTKVDLTVFEELQSDVKENELVTARALTELNDKKADADDLNSAVSSLNSSINTKANQSDLDALSAEVEENEDVTAAALTELHENKADKSDLENLVTDEDLNAVNQAKLDIETYNTDKTNTDSRISTLEGKTKLSDFTDDLTRGYTSVDHGTSDTTFALTPNVYHIWGEVTSLTLTFDTEVSGFANEYLIQFTSGTTATTLSLPDTVKWANENAISIETGKTYSISILNNLAVFAVFTN